MNQSNVPPAPVPDVRQVSSFPPPPMEYIREYTDIKVRQGLVPKPPPPIEGPYTCFGVPCCQDDQILRPLESQNIRRLYPTNYSHRTELKKLNFSVLCNFLDLLDILIKNPSSEKRNETLRHISDIFINMHHLVNEYRPHQARDTLREIMAHQLSTAQQTGELARTYVNRCADCIAKAKAELPSDAELNQFESRLNDLLADRPSSWTERFRTELQHDADEIEEREASAIDSIEWNMLEPEKKRSKVE